MRRDIGESHALKCVPCGGNDVCTRDDNPGRCAYCAQYLPAGHFQAQGVEAMGAQTQIIANYNKAVTVRTIAAYATSVTFAVISAWLIIYAPEQRETAANLVASAFLVLAVGIAGFTRFRAKAPAIEIEAGDRNSK
jgi:hypothetical protein